MRSVIHFLELDDRKESIAVSIAPSNSVGFRPDGQIGGTVDDVNRTVK